MGSSIYAFLVLPFEAILPVVTVLLYPVGVVPPSQCPLLARVWKLSFSRSARFSRSICANTEVIIIMAFPIGVEVSKDSLTDTKLMPHSASWSDNMEKSLTLREIRSN